MSDKKREIKNGRITATSLGREDHGIFTAMLTIEGDGWGCGFGGYVLDDKPRERKAGARRHGTAAYGMEFIIRILDTLEIEKWEDLPGTVVRVDSEGWGGRINRIGHFIKEQWFDPAQLREEMEAVAKESVTP